MSEKRWYEKGRYLLGVAVAGALLTIPIKALFLPGMETLDGLKNEYVKINKKCGLVTDYSAILDHYRKMGRIVDNTLSHPDIQLRDNRYCYVGVEVYYREMPRPATLADERRIYKM